MRKYVLRKNTLRKKSQNHRSIHEENPSENISIMQIKTYSSKPRLHQRFLEDVRNPRESPCNLRGFLRSFKQLSRKMIPYCAQVLASSTCERSKSFFLTEQRLVLGQATFCLSGAQSLHLARVTEEDNDNKQTAHFITTYAR